MGFYEFTPERMSFDFAFQSRGGLYASEIENLFEPDPLYDSFRESAANLVKHVLNKYKLPNSPKIYVDFIDNTSLGAAVTKFEDTYHIGIYCDSIIILNSVFHRMLSCPSVLTNYGNISVENQDYKLYNLEITNFHNLTIQFDKMTTPTPFLTPVDAQRKIVANTLVTLAINYLVAHELGHILHGHVDYLKSTGILTWDESEDIPEKSLTIEVAQALEYDADCFAQNVLMNYALASHEAGGFFSSSAKFMGKTEGDLIGVLIFAIYTTFRLFGNNVPSNNLLSKKHPHPKLRRALLGVGVSSLLDYRVANDNFNQSRVMPIFISAMSYILEVEMAFGAIASNGNTLSEEEKREIIIAKEALTYLNILNKR